MDPAKPPQIGREYGAQTLGALLMRVSARLCLLAMLDQRVHIALHHPIAAGRVGIQPTARFERQSRCLLDRLDGDIAGRLADDSPLATDPRDDRRSVCVIMPAARRALLAAPTCTAPQRRLPTVLRWALLTSHVRAFLRVPGALHLRRHLIRQRGIPQPPAPPIARPAMDPPLPRHAPGRTGQAQQTGGADPGRQRPLAPVYRGRGAVVERVLA